MRFIDHRGVKPIDVQVTGNTMSAKLTRSKTTGDDKDVAFRMVPFRLAVAWSHHPGSTQAGLF